MKKNTKTFHRTNDKLLLANLAATVAAGVEVATSSIEHRENWPPEGVAERAVLIAQSILDEVFLADDEEE